MILKIATEKGWAFIDHIKEIHVTKWSSQTFNEQHFNEVSKQYNDVFLCYHTMKAVQADVCEVGHSPDSFWEIAPTSHSTEFGAVELVALFDDGVYRVYLADLAVYLLSDEGKTIEKIHS